MFVKEQVSSSCERVESDHYSLKEFHSNANKELCWDDDVYIGIANSGSSRVSQLEL